MSSEELGKELENQTHQIGDETEFTSGVNWDYIAAEVKSLPVCPELPPKGRLTSRSAAWLGLDELPGCLVAEGVMQGTACLEHPAWNLSLNSACASLGSSLFCVYCSGTCRVLRRETKDKQKIAERVSTEKAGHLRCRSFQCMFPLLRLIV